jgi:hypothetical protein
LSVLKEVKGRGLFGEYLFEYTTKSRRVGLDGRSGNGGMFLTKYLFEIHR